MFHHRSCRQEGGGQPGKTPIKPRSIQTAEQNQYRSAHNSRANANQLKTEMACSRRRKVPTTGTTAGHNSCHQCLEHPFVTNEIENTSMLASSLETQIRKKTMPRPSGRSSGSLGLPLEAKFPQSDKRARLKGPLERQPESQSRNRTPRQEPTRKNTPKQQATHLHNKRVILYSICVCTHVCVHASAMYQRCMYLLEIRNPKACP
jgi:hypothetical protein